MANKIRVLIIDDSMMFRTVLTKAITERGDIEVVGTAGDPYEAKDEIVRLKPDVLTLDVEMPKMNGIDFLKKLLPQYPIPVIVVTSTPTNAFEAISAGAVDFIKKPEKARMNEFSAELRQMIKTASTAKVMLKRTATRAAISGTGRTLSTGSANPRKLIALGASTGGTEALQVVLQDMPADTPGVVVVQHMPAGFTKMYADRLNRICHMEVREAKDGDRVTPGLVLIAAGEHHMRLKRDAGGYYVTSRPGDKVSGHCPSVDVLFESVAEVAGKNAVGAILTGMGSDGAKGLLRMRQTGSYTVGQDKDSCVVYGMPMVAFNIGAVERQAPLDSVASLLLDRIRR